VVDETENSLLHEFVGDGRPLLMLFAAALAACGAFAIFQAATGHLLPHDSAFLGMTARDLCAVQQCRIHHFMVHDRVSFGGVLLAIAALYGWLVLYPLARRESWAWWTLVASGAAGFLSFLAYLGYGYLDTWHGAATLALLPLFGAGIVRSRALRSVSVAPPPIHLGSRAAIGRALLLLASVGISIGGLVIMSVGMTTVFVPQDLEFIGQTRAAIGAINPHLLPLIAHDRAGFGGALVSFGVAMFGSVRFAPLSRAFRQALAIAGTAGFAAAIGVHPAIGYVNVTHLGPAVLGAAVFGIGLALSSTHDRRPMTTLSPRASAAVPNDELTAASTP
jgi:hypothetical protein